MPRSLPCLFALSLCFPAGAADSAPVDFRADVLPLLADRCFACHGPDEDTREAELRFDRRESVFGNRETPLLVPGKPAQSNLYVRISSSDPDVHMPPPDATRQLTAEEVDLIRVWIEQGAQWEEHWSFQPIERPPVPIAVDLEWIRNPIDGFILSRLDAEKLGNLGHCLLWIGK